LPHLFAFRSEEKQTEQLWLSELPGKVPKVTFLAGLADISIIVNTPDFQDDRPKEPYDLQCGDSSFCGLRSGMWARLLIDK
jgi:hypothetical protein